MRCQACNVTVVRGTLAVAHYQEPDEIRVEFRCHYCKTAFGIPVDYDRAEIVEAGRLKEAG